MLLSVSIPAIPQPALEADVTTHAHRLQVNQWLVPFLGSKTFFTLAQTEQTVKKSSPRSGGKHESVKMSYVVHLPPL